MKRSKNNVFNAIIIVLIISLLILPSRQAVAAASIINTTGAIQGATFYGAGTGLTGTASGLAIGGNAGTATALAANPADCGANTWATAIAANGALTCGAVTYAGITAATSANWATVISDESGTGVIAFTNSPVFTTPNIGSATGSISGNAGTATALAANGANCLAGNYPLGVDASGAVETCTADDDTPDTDAEVPDAITVSGGTIGSNTVSSGATWTTAGTLTIGDNGDNIVINANNWDVSSGGVGAFATGTTIAGSTAWHAGNDGTGSGLDADTLDGSSSAAFMSASADNWVNTNGDTMSSNLTFSQVGAGIIGTYDPSKTQAVWAMGAAYTLPIGGGTAGSQGSLYGLGWSYEPDYGGAGNNPQSKAGLSHQLLVMINGVTYTAIGNGVWTAGNVNSNGGTLQTAGVTRISNTGVGTLASGTTIAGSTAWHAGNDGAGSGLDADTLDGSSSAAFYLATNPSNYITDGNTNWDNSYGYITDDTSVPKNHLANSGALGFTWSDAEVSDTLTASTATTSTYSTYLWSTSHPGQYYISNAWDGARWLITSNHGAAVRVAYADAAADLSCTNCIGATEITDGAGSGLDADLLDGLSSASYQDKPTDWTCTLRSASATCPLNGGADCSFSLTASCTGNEKVIAGGCEAQAMFTDGSGGAIGGPYGADRPTGQGWRCAGTTRSLETAYAYANCCA